jgi:hypothetical protein
MKKTWIKIKRGLLEPKHRDRLGIRIWLYFYILDQADWDAGKVLEWRDGDAADDLQMPKRTIRQQRQQLETDGYITCKLAGNKQIITIHNYTNPRKYDGEVVNSKGDKNLTPTSKRDNKGDIQGDNKGLSKPRTPSYSSHNINHKSKRKSRKRDERLDHPAIKAYRAEAHLHVPIPWRDEVVSAVDDAERWQKIVHSWVGKGWNKQNIEGMLEVYNNGWGKNGKGKTKEQFVEWS